MPMGPYPAKSDEDVDDGVGPIPGQQPAPGRPSAGSRRGRRGTLWAPTKRPPPSVECIFSGVPMCQPVGLRLTKADDDRAGESPSLPPPVRCRGISGLDGGFWGVPMGLRPTELHLDTAASAR